MGGLLRLLDGLMSGEATAVYVLIFVVVGTILIYAATEVIRRRR